MAEGEERPDMRSGRSRVCVYPPHLSVKSRQVVYDA